MAPAWIVTYTILAVIWSNLIGLHTCTLGCGSTTHVQAYDTRPSLSIVKGLARQLNSDSILGIACRQRQLTNLGSVCILSSTEVEWP
jgi:hypothetical protein